MGQNAGAEMPFSPRKRRFVPGQKGGTERLGQKGWDRTSRYPSHRDYSEHSDLKKYKI